MKITKRQLRKLIRESHIQILAEEEERIMFDTEKLSFSVPKKLQKLLDPDITPQKFAALDADLDATGKPKQQGFAIAAYALTYADNDYEKAKKLLKLAIMAVDQIKKDQNKKGSGE